MNLNLSPLYGFKVQNPMDVVRMNVCTDAPSFLGMPVHLSPLATRKGVGRVRGGYMNRWLIRAEVQVPSYYVAGGVICMHPDLWAKVSKLPGFQP